MSNRIIAAIALAASFGFLSGQANAVGIAVSGTGTGGAFVPLAGSAINNVQGGVGLFSTGPLAFNTGVLADGMSISGIFQETVAQTANLTTSYAWLSITSIQAIDTNPAVNTTATDNLYLFSDVFDPSLAVGAGVGIVGNIANGSVNPEFGDSTQGQMNYLTTPVGFGLGPSFFLNTPQVAYNLPGLTLQPFWAATILPGLAVVGVQQLIGVVNFTELGLSSINMPGSFIIEENDPAPIQAELPEPGSFFLLGSSLIGLAALGRRRRG